MTCFANREDQEDLPVIGECPNCGADVDENGEATEQCEYSPCLCEKCGHRPCDESC